MGEVRLALGPTYDGYPFLSLLFNNQQPTFLKAVFSWRESLNLGMVALSFFIWQIVFNYGLIRLKTFVSRFSTKLCN